MQSKTKQVILARQESAIVKNCGKIHLKIFVSECPSLLAGKTNKLIKQSGLIISPLAESLFERAITLSVLEIVIDILVPQIIASIPKYCGITNRQTIKNILPIT